MEKIILLSLTLFFFTQCKIKDNGGVMCPDPPKLSEEYTEELDVPHCVLLILEKEKDRMKLINRRMDIIVFNEKNGFENIKANNGFALDDNNEKKWTITVRGFQSLSEANVYIQILKKKKKLKADEKILPFSQDNYRRFLKNINLEEYEVFYSSTI